MGGVVVRESIVVTCLLLALACGTAHAPEVSTGPVEGTVSAPDGVSIAYQVRGAGETTLVFVHCWSCDQKFWRDQIEVFAEDYRVVTLDLAGHGASGADREEWTIAGLAADVEAVANELDLDRIVLVGHSMGGPVSLLAAQRLPDRAVGVVCVDTLHNAEFQMPEAMTEMFAKQLNNDPEAFMRQFAPAMFKQDANPALVEWVITEALTADLTATTELMRDFDDLDMPAAFSGAGVPIRCINAAPQGGQQATEIEINRKYSDFDAVLIDNVGHYIQLERSEQFNEQLRTILQQF
jgi:sigma-B regulation protein RsbQ